MDRKLTEIGTIPVTTSIIESLYPELKSADKKVTGKTHAQQKLNLLLILFNKTL